MVVRVWFSFISISVVVVVVCLFCCCCRFHSCSFVYTTRILNVNVFQTNKWQPTCMKWAQHIQKQAERFLLFYGFFLSFFSFCFVSFLLFLFVFKKKTMSIRSFSKLFTSFTLLFTLVSSNYFISIETS